MSVTTTAPVVTVSLDRATSPDGRVLIEASDAALEEFFPPEECFSLDARELDATNVTFWIARIAGEALGCVALVDMQAYGEIKRLYVSPKARGTGVGRLLMKALEAHARDSDMQVVKLETGDALKPAMALYTDLGYTLCHPFGGYPDIASNTFLEKRLF